MTDGDNTTTDHGDANEKLRRVCEAVKQAGVELYTIAFQISWGEDTDPYAIKELLSQCATSVSYYYDAQNNAALQAAFANIARQIVVRRSSRLRLVR